MDQIFELEIISTTLKQVFAVTGIEVESTSGSFFVGYGHMPLVSIVRKKSILVYHLADGTNVRLQINGGVLNVAQNKALIVLDL